MSLQERRGLFCCIERHAKLCQQLRAFKEASLFIVAAQTDKDALLGNATASGNNRFEISIFQIFAKAGHLAGRGHLDPQNGISSGQAGERELRSLDRSKIQRWQSNGGNLLKERINKQLDKVDPRHLRDKREGTRRPEIGLNHIDLIVFREKLNVEWSRDR